MKTYCTILLLTLNIAVVKAQCTGETPTILPGSIPDISICSGTSTSGVQPMSNLIETTFEWIGTASSGSVSGFTNLGQGPIPTEVITNSSSFSETITYTIVPSANGCTGEPVDYVVTIVPVPNTSHSGANYNESICSGTPTSGVQPTSNLIGTTFEWSCTASSGFVSGFTNLGQGSIPSEVVTSTSSFSETITYTIVPSANGCPGAPEDYTVTIEPVPIASHITPEQIICESSTTFTVDFFSNVPETGFSWNSIASLNVQGQVPSGTGPIPAQTLSNSSDSVAQLVYEITPSTSVCLGPSLIHTINITPTPDAQFDNINGTLTPRHEQDTYSWLDCNQNSIEVSNDRNFTPPSPGSYQLEVTTEGCLSTSSCFEFVILGNPDESNVDLHAYPIPVATSLKLNRVQEWVLFNALGKEVMKGSEISIDFSNMNPGLYYLTTSNQRVRVVKE